MSSRIIDTGTTDLQAEVNDGVAVLTMNRPDRRNALSDDMLMGMQAALAECATASDVRCVVLTGAGGAMPKVFALSANCWAVLAASATSRQNSGTARAGSAPGFR